MNWKKAKSSEIYKKFLDFGYSQLTAITLSKAGIETIEEADDFLNGNELHSFHLIRNIDMATEIIWQHIFEGNKICVFGDYDADGVTSSAIMFLALKRLGANACVRLPDRITEGYGISKKAILEQLELGTKLFITVDNGVRAVEETKFVKENGADIVILDHHEPGEILPEADALIDLHVPGETYPFIELTGSGLSWKIAHCLLEQVGEHEFAMSLIDLAAIGTVGDVAPLLGENRVIVKRALQIMRRPDYNRPGVKALLRDMSNLTAEDIAFKLAPCLNAPGRLNERGAELSLILLLESDSACGEKLANASLRDNEFRKQMQSECYNAIRQDAEQRVAKGDKVLVLFAENAPSGIVGLLAGNLKEEYNRPSIVFSPKADINGELKWTGSARSVDAFHMLNGIEQCAELLEAYGGHKLAAGLTVKPENFEAFRTKINAVADYLTEEDLQPVSHWDWCLTEEMLSDDLFDEMNSLEPFGAGVPKPMLRLPIKLKENESHKFIGTEGQHLKLFAKEVSLLGFSLADKYMKMCLPEEIVAFGCLSLNWFRGECYKEIFMVDFITAESEERGEVVGRQNEYETDLRIQDRQSIA